MVATCSRLLRVSRSWKSLLSAIPSLWSHIDLSAATKMVSMAAIRSYVQQSRGTASQASLQLLTKNHVDIIGYIARTCEILGRIDITHGTFLQVLVEKAPLIMTLRILNISSKCDVDLKIVTQLLGHCENLERAEFNATYTSQWLHEWQGNMSQLRSLTINSGTPQDLGAPLNIVSAWSV